MLITTELAAVVLLVVGLTVGVALAGGPSALGRLMDGSATPSAADLATFVTVLVGVSLAGLLSVPVAVIGYGGLIHLTDRAQAGLSSTVREGWAFGLRRLGRTLAIELAYGAAATALMLATMLPLVAIFAGVAVGSDAAAATGAIVGICGFSIMMLLAVAALYLLSGLEALAIRYALIGDRTAGDALRAGWVAFRVQFKSVLLFVLILIGFGMIVYVVQSVVNVGVQFFVTGSTLISDSGPTSASTELLSRIIPIFILAYLVTFTLALVMRVFQTAMWTGFFRQMTGLEPLSPIPADNPDSHRPTGLGGYIPPEAPVPPAPTAPAE